MPDKPPIFGFNKTDALALKERAAYDRQQGLIHDGFHSIPEYFNYNTPGWQAYKSLDQTFDNTTWTPVTDFTEYFNCATAFFNTVDVDASYHILLSVIGVYRFSISLEFEVDLSDSYPNIVSSFETRILGDLTGVIPKSRIVWDQFPTCLDNDQYTIEKTFMVYVSQPENFRLECRLTQSTGLDPLILLGGGAAAYEGCVMGIQYVCPISG